MGKRKYYVVITYIDNDGEKHETELYFPNHKSWVKNVGELHDLYARQMRDGLIKEYRIDGVQLKG